MGNARGYNRGRYSRGTTRGASNTEAGPSQPKKKAGKDVDNAAEVLIEKDVEEVIDISEEKGKLPLTVGFANSQLRADAFHKRTPRRGLKRAGTAYWTDDVEMFENTNPVLVELFDPYGSDIFWKDFRVGDPSTYPKRHTALSDYTIGRMIQAGVDLKKLANDHPLDFSPNLGLRKVRVPHGEPFTCLDAKGRTVFQRYAGYYLMVGDWYSVIEFKEEDIWLNKDYSALGAKHGSTYLDPRESRLLTPSEFHVPKDKTLLMTAKAALATKNGVYIRKKIGVEKIKPEILTDIDSAINEHELDEQQQEASESQEGQPVIDKRSKKRKSVLEYPSDSDDLRLEVNKIVSKAEALKIEKMIHDAAQKRDKQKDSEKPAKAPRLSVSPAGTYTPERTPATHESQTPQYSTPAYASESSGLTGKAVKRPKLSMDAWMEKQIAKQTEKKAAPTKDDLIAQEKLGGQFAEALLKLYEIDRVHIFMQKSLKLLEDVTDPKHKAGVHQLSQLIGFARHYNNILVPGSDTAPAVMKGYFAELAKPTNLEGLLSQLFEDLPEDWDVEDSEPGDE